METTTWFHITPGYNGTTIEGFGGSLSGTIDNSRSVSARPSAVLEPRQTCESGGLTIVIRKEEPQALIDALIDQ